MEQIAIIGAGAAGCFAAANITSNGNRAIVLFEKASRAMQKVKVSGGGRCNVTHACYDIPELSERYPRGKQLLRKTLYHFGPSDMETWLSQRGVQLKTEPDGRMFPVTDDSQTIIDAIWTEMMTRQVQVRFGRSVSDIERRPSGFRIHFQDGGIYDTDKVLVTTGGYQKTSQYDWLQQLGHTIEPPAPSLFTFNIPDSAITGLMGVSTEASVKIAGTKFAERGPLLITHWGLSGPAVLRTSAWAARELQGRDYQFKVLINWLPEYTEDQLRAQITGLRSSAGKQPLTSKNPFELPRRLWEYLLQRSAIMETTRWAELPAALQNKLIGHLIRDEYEVKGKTTFKEEFVTCGGIKLSEVNPQTMESRIVPGLFFAGEVLDVDGITGGYNFQHAWSSGYIAANAISNSR